MELRVAYGENQRSLAEGKSKSHNNIYVRFLKVFVFNLCTSVLFYLNSSGVNSER